MGRAVLKISLKIGLGLMLGLFKRKTPRLEKYLLKEKVSGKCLPSEQEESPRGGENRAFGWLAGCQEGRRAG